MSVGELKVEARQTLGRFVLNASFTAQSGVTALFGHSGSGKTSLVRVIAGLSRPDFGRVSVGDDLLLDTDRGIEVPKHRRRFGYVFQEARLFPHLSVRHNLLYGRWFARRTAESSEFERVVEMLGIASLLERRTTRLSGGERQRVAIGRALLSAPRLLLMDEPLAALDEDRKAEILPYLERLRDESSMPIVYVSHSVSEVARLADRVVLMNGGSIEAFGTPSDVFSHARDRRDAGAVLTGRVLSLDPVHRLVTVGLSNGRIIVPNADVEPGRSVRLHLPERDVLIATQRPEGLSALNMLEGKVAAIEAEADGMARVRVLCGTDVVTSRITTFSVERLQLQLGMNVFAIVKTVALKT